ncbi:hypothetical protein Tco_1576400 [Tanacetum coccineum]
MDFTKAIREFQKIFSSKEIHRAVYHTEDANQKISNDLYLLLGYQSLNRDKPGIDSLSFDDLYNNLESFENDVKSSTASSSNLPNVAFVSENTTY